MPSERWLAVVGWSGLYEVSDHLDGDPSNNALANLEWGTAAENAADRVRHGTAPRGAEAGRARLSESDVRSIRSLSATRSQQSIADEFGVAQTTVSAIVRGLIWRHLC